MARIESNRRRRARRRFADVAMSPPAVRRIRPAACWTVAPLQTRGAIIFVVSGH